MKCKRVYIGKVKRNSLHLETLVGGIILPISDKAIAFLLILGGNIYH
jgi:hypothetical protein